jgi:hypothetical protein
MNENKFTSHAEWPPSELFISGNISVDLHPSREAAEAVCKMLQNNGLGGDRKIFPLRTWVEPIQRSYDILNNGRPISIIWAVSPEHALTIFRAAHKTTANLHHAATKLGHLTAVPRLQ